MSNQYHTRAHSDVNTLSGGDLEGPFLPRLMPIRPSDKRPYEVSEGGFRHGLLGQTDGAMIERWASRFRGCGWAVRTGAIEGLNQSPLIVLDVDDVDAAPDWVHDRKAFPWRVSTRRGVHLYSWTGEPLRTRHLPWGDVLATRSYAVSWQSNRSYTPAPGFGLGQIPLWPASILADLDRTDASDTPQQVVPRPSGSGRRLTPSRADIPIGGRNDGLFRRLLLQAGRDRGVRGDVARLTGQARWINEGLTAPLPDREVTKVAASVAGYSAGWERSTAAYRERQRARGQRSGEARRARTGDRDASIVAMRAAGLSVSAIARQVGVTTRTVYRIIKAI